MELAAVGKKRTRIIVKRGIEHLVLRLEHVALFWVFGRIVFVFDREGNKYVIDKNLINIIDTLDPHIFFRVNRKAVVNCNYIRSYKAYEIVKLKIELTVEGLPDGLIVSQERASVFKEWISNL
jgi:DNA-binding LytR/AlgR family response regulator